MKRGVGPPRWTIRLCSDASERRGCRRCHSWLCESVEVATARFHPLQQVRLVVVSANDIRGSVDPFGQHFRRPALVAVMRYRARPNPVWGASRRTARFIPMFASLAVPRVAVMGTDTVPARLGDDVEPGANRSLRHSTRSLLTGEEGFPTEFIGHVAPARSVEQAESFYEQISAEDDDATHNVPAYRVPAADAGAGSTGVNGAGTDGPADDTGRSPTGDGMLREYSSDDGEPSGSAGKPALNVLQQRELRNLVCVVTRYYGGTNLGVGGLARAYGRAVKEAVDAAGVTERRPRERFTVTVSYDDSGSVRGLLESAGATFEASYDERVEFVVAVPVGDADGLRDRIRSRTSGRAEID